MRTTAFCTAKTYQLSAIQRLYKRFGYQVVLLGKVLQVTSACGTVAVFFFSNGVFVSWGLSRVEELATLDHIQPYSEFPLKHIEKRYFLCCAGDKTEFKTIERFHMEMISLARDEFTDFGVKLALSYGVAQSIRLESYEEAIQQTIKKNLSIIDVLASTGKIGLSSKAILRRKGEIFLARSSVNLSSDFLDLPEYFWENPHLESYYELTEQYLDIKRRVQALNQQLDVLHELFDVLTGQLQHKHSSLLEMIIILLIFIEILLTLFKMIF